MVSSLYVFVCRVCEVVVRELTRLGDKHQTTTQHTHTQDERMDALNAQALAHMVSSLAFVQHRPSQAMWKHACARAGQLFVMAKESEPGSFGFSAQSRVLAAAAAAARVAAGEWLLMVLSHFLFEQHCFLCSVKGIGCSLLTAERGTFYSLKSVSHYLSYTNTQLQQNPHEAHPTNPCV